MRISCIAMDDEPLALKKVASYIERIPFLELVAQCRNAFEAMEVMRSRKVQLLFVDINMPALSGMDFVKSLNEKPYIVFTTAYSEYAVEGFQVEAVDYLLKPITFVNVLKAANKVKAWIDLNASNQVGRDDATTDHLFVKSSYKLLRVEFSNIKYLESQHEYVKIVLMTGKPVLTKMSLKSIEELLPTDQFMRVHRSYIVSINKVVEIERSSIVFDSKVYVPVSKNYQAKFQHIFNGKAPLQINT